MRRWRRVTFASPRSVLRGRLRCRSMITIAAVADRSPPCGRWPKATGRLSVRTADAMLRERFSPRLILRQCRPSAVRPMLQTSAAHMLRSGWPIWAAATAPDATAADSGQHAPPRIVRTVQRAFRAGALGCFHTRTSLRPHPSGRRWPAHACGVAGLVVVGRCQGSHVRHLPYGCLAARVKIWPRSNAS